MYKYFTEDELKCGCCGKVLMHPSFMEKLEEIREECGFPFYLTSAYRCPKHNNEVSSTGFSGPHTSGRAVDIKANSRDKFLIMEAAYRRGINRFGIGNGFIHIDDLEFSDGFDEKVIWTY